MSRGGEKRVIFCIAIQFYCQSPDFYVSFHASYKPNSTPLYIYFMSCQKNFFN